MNAHQELGEPRCVDPTSAGVSVKVFWALWQLGTAPPGPVYWSQSLLELETSRPAAALVSVKTGVSAGVKLDSLTRTAHPVVGLQSKIQSARSYLNRKSVSVKETYTMNTKGEFT